MTFSHWAEARMLDPTQRAIALRAWRSAKDLELDACIEICRVEAEAAPWDDGNAARAAMKMMMDRRNKKNEFVPNRSQDFN